jgi:hypothetical protein
MGDPAKRKTLVDCHREDFEQMRILETALNTLVGHSKGMTGTEIKVQYRGNIFGVRLLGTVEEVL